jgi:C1A family cysteine protease
MASLFATVFAVFNATALPSFYEWAGLTGRDYKGVAETLYRKGVYEDNLRTIINHNTEGHSWKMGVNKFADLTADEFKARYTGGYRARNHKKSGRLGKTRQVYKDLPAGIDWRTEGAVTPVKNQQQCGSCWSFSTTGAIEGAWFLSNGTLVSLSEQQLIDCSTAQGNQGCNGGMMDYAFEYVIQNGGLTTEDAYPYTATGPNTCEAAGKSIAAKISGYTDVPANSDNALMLAVSKQPVSVAIEADQAAFQFYTSGVLTAACGSSLDHGVLVVGYNSAAWIVKNSWGADWGDNGYIQLARGSAYDPAGQCGILSDPSYPTV